MTKYRFLALDIDGTLIGPDERVGPEAVEVLEELQRSGMHLCLATGRAYPEAIPVWRQLRLADPPEPLVLVGGALVSEGPTGRTIYQRTIDRASACDLAGLLARAGYSVVAAVDGWRHGVDYYRTTEGHGNDLQERWLKRNRLNVRTVARLEDDPDMPNPLRISAVVRPGHAAELAEQVKARFNGSLNVHFIYLPVYDFTVLEAFAGSASKLAAVIYVAQAQRIGRGQIVAVGDDVNDLPMIRGVKLGVAMPQSPPAVQQAASHVASGGLVEFLRQLLAGKFDQ